MVPSSRVKCPRRKLGHFLDTLPLKMGLIGCPETSVLDQPTLRNNPDDGRIKHNNRLGQNFKHRLFQNKIHFSTSDFTSNTKVTKIKTRILRLQQTDK